ncbi:MAG: hypothetical protein LCH34_06790 [Firmicutes bacterium]|nr:hypothetical protein [Bacillota bacterium]
MEEPIISDKMSNINKKLFQYSQELVMLNYVYEQKLLSKDEMLSIKKEIMKNYGVQKISL